MTHEIIMWVLGLIATIFGGVNIVQLINNRELKRKLSAEGYQQEIAALQNIIAGCNAEVDRLQRRCDESDSRYDALRSKYDDLEKKYDELRALITGKH